MYFYTFELKPTFLVFPSSPPSILDEIWTEEGAGLRKTTDETLSWDWTHVPALSSGLRLRLWHTVPSSVTLMPFPNGPGALYTRYVGDLE